MKQLIGSGYEIALPSLLNLIAVTQFGMAFVLAGRQPVGAFLVVGSLALVTSRVVSWLTL